MNLLELCSPIMLDSGAFSAWTKRVDIDLHEYIDFALQYVDKLDSIVVLDCIPGSPGETKLRPSQVRDSAEKSWKNFQIMLKAGIPREKLVPVFHQNEEDRFLQRMIEEAPYFGLSPANDRGTGEKVKWLDRCMRIACDEQGLPKNKWHGFAVTSVLLMQRFPWYSVDSASWRLQAVYGKILMVSRVDDGKIISGFYDVSEKRITNDHIDNLSPKIKELFLDQIEAKGFDYSLLRTNGLYRAFWNMISFSEFQKTLPVWPWCYQHKSKGFKLL